MNRFQSSWLQELLLENIQDFSKNPKWFFPCMSQFNALEWLSLMNMTIKLNIPVHSQAILGKCWFANSENFPDEDSFSYFNKEIDGKQDININPFKSWLSNHFTKNQLDYLSYWHEYINQQNDESAKMAYKSMVALIINYWVSNNKSGIKTIYRPDEILTLYYKRFKDFKKQYITKYKITEQSLDEISSEDCSVVVFNPIWSDEDFCDDTSILIFDAWEKGQPDLEEASKRIKESLKSNIVELSSNTNYSFYKKMAENAKCAAFCWSGNGISPQQYQRHFVEPVQKLFADRYKQSKLTYKSVDTSVDAYDYTLLFW